MGLCWTCYSTDLLLCETLGVPGGNDKALVTVTRILFEVGAYRGFLLGNETGCRLVEQRMEMDS